MQPWQAGFPTRSCVRSMRDFGDRDENDLSRGVYTFIADGSTDLEEYASYINVMLVGQIFAGEDAEPEAVEEIELTMIDEVLALQRVSTPHIEIQQLQQSRQLEVPYGWFRAQLKVGPIDLTPAAPDAELDDFVTFHADWDVPPHETAAEHGKWLEEPPDHAATVPDAADDVTLEQ